MKDMMEKRKKKKKDERDLKVEKSVEIKKKI